MPAKRQKQLRTFFHSELFRTFRAYSAAKVFMCFTAFPFIGELHYNFHYVVVRYLHPLLAAALSPQLLPFDWFHFTPALNKWMQ